MLFDEVYTSEYRRLVTNVTKLSMYLPLSIDLLEENVNLYLLASWVVLRSSLLALTCDTVFVRRSAQPNKTKPIMPP